MIVSSGTHGPEGFAGSACQLGLLGDPLLARATANGVAVLLVHAVNAYGFSPYAATDEEGHTEHGNDERIRVEELRRGPRILFDVVAAVAGAR